MSTESVEVDEGEAMRRFILERYHRAARELLEDVVAGLYLAPDNGGDLCLWRDDPGRPGWPEHLAWQGGVDPAVWAIVEAVVPRREVSGGA